MSDPSFASNTISSLDIAGVLISHLIFAFSATILINWNWIPLTESEASRGKRIEDIKNDLLY